MNVGKNAKSHSNLPAVNQFCAVPVLVNRETSIKPALAVVVMADQAIDKCTPQFVTSAVEKRRCHLNLQAISRYTVAIASKAIAQEEDMEGEINEVEEIRCRNR